MAHKGPVDFHNSANSVAHPSAQTILLHSLVSVSSASHISGFLTVTMATSNGGLNSTLSVFVLSAFMLVCHSHARSSGPYRTANEQKGHMFVFMLKHLVF